MKRALVTVSSIALIVAIIEVAVGIDFNVQGALNTDGVERFAGADNVAIVVTALDYLGIVLMFVVVALVAASAVMRRQWGWLIAVLALLPLGLYSWLALGFEGGLGLGALPPLVPLMALVYAARLPAEASVPHGN
jgi:hypothetical protein